MSEDSLAKGVLREGDILLCAALNGEKTQITRQHHMIDRMLDARVGDTVTLTVLRAGAETDVSFTVTEGCMTAY